MYTSPSIYPRNASKRTDAGHDLPQLRSRDGAAPVLVKDLEGGLDLRLAVRVAHLAGHHRQELGKVDRAVPVHVDLVDHVLQLRLGGVLPERAHDGAEFLGGDGAIAIWGRMR